MKAGDPNWHSRVEAPLVLAGDDAVEWSDAADVVIIGLGGAGVCAALEALDAGASVVAIDRFAGGGATRMSGGVVYAGGGTRYQREAGVQDDPANMFEYLKHEVGDAVSEATLRDFCDTSVDQIAWLESHGVRFNSTLSPIKTSYPADGCYLYYSGNEGQADYMKTARPAQRGHRTFGKSLTGHLLFDALFRAAVAKGLKVIPYAEARRFLLSESGEIAGVEIRQVEARSSAARRLDKLAAKFARSSTLLFPRIAEKLKLQAAQTTEENANSRNIRAWRAVILTAGGYVHNRDMVRHYASKYLGAIPLGSIGCDGSGIRLGQSVGADVSHMDNISAWRQFQPPRAFATGIVVNAKGDRFVAEDCYGATIGYEIAQQPGSAAYIIIDSTLRKQALEQAMPGKGRLFRLQGAPALMGLFLSSNSAPTLQALAAKCGMDAATLTASVEHYNRSIDGEVETQFPKHPDFTGKLAKAPFTAIDISLGNRRYLCPSISLGGIVVDETTGRALGADGQPIPKLFAAGKNACGISSRRYVSGISIADCIYSGRKAGRAAASKED